MGFNPTAEQVAILDAAPLGGDTVIDAGAGTGKTTTLKGISAVLKDKRGLYVAYNKAIQLDAAATFPQNTRCKTGHALAYGAVGNKYRSRLNSPRVTARQTATILGIKDPFIISADLVLKPWQIARIVMDTVKRYSYSADRTIKPFHVPLVPGTERTRNDLADFILPLAVKAWDDLQGTTGKLRFEHDHYVKIWALTDPTIKADFILFDEAQDANPVIEAVIRAQDAQKFYVGDRCQAIYGWRGAQDAMSKFNADNHFVLSQSFRFGPAVAEEANKWLDVLDAPLRLIGFDGIDSQLMPLDEADAILCRTNAQVVATALEAQQRGKQTAIVGGTAEIRRFAEAALELQQGRGTAHPDLTVFQTWGQVQEYVQGDEGGDLKVFVKLIDTYGVPTVMQVADNAVDESEADVIVSTAHRAKGREWHRVRIANDFKEPEGEDAMPERSEAMLAYVAVTRAQFVLDNSGLNWIDNYRTQGTVEA